MKTHSCQLLSALVGGVLLSFAFPPSGFDFLAWIAFIPLFRALHLDSRPSRAFLSGFVFGFSFFLVDVNWVYDTLVIHGHFSAAPAVAVFLSLILFLSLFPAGFAVVLSLFAKNGVNAAAVAPFLWVGQEYVRAVAFTGFPWDLVGYSQAGWLPIIQVADVTGVYGISFLVLLVNSAIWEVIRTRLAKERIPWRLPAVAALAIVITLAYGNMRLNSFPATPSDTAGFKAAILQGNIPQEVKWEEAARKHTFATYEKLGREAVKEGAKLLIWPETSAPVVFGSGDDDWLVPGLISERLGVPMLVGAPSARMLHGIIAYYNSAFLVDANMLRFRYDKIHLVPFGEYMPLSSVLPLGPGIAAREADYSAGETMTVMRSNDGPRFSVLICYEAIFPDLARTAVRNGARLIVNITNDGWFGETGAPYQHLAMAGFRGVENRFWVLRAANTGVSAAFDPAGRMVKSIPLQKEGFFTVTVPRSDSAQTFYNRFGDVFVWGCLAIPGILGLSIARWQWVKSKAGKAR